MFISRKKFDNLVSHLASLTSQHVATDKTVNKLVKELDELKEELSKKESIKDTPVDNYYSVYNLREFSRDHSLTCKQLSNILGVSVSTLSNWKKNPQRVPTSKQKDIEAALRSYLKLNKKQQKALKG